MIKLASKDDFNWVLLLSKLSPYGVKISSNLLAYGFDFPSLKFWLQRHDDDCTAVLMEFDGIGFLEAKENADFAELSAFLKCQNFKEFSARLLVFEKLNFKATEQKPMFEYSSKNHFFEPFPIKDLKEAYELISSAISNSFKTDDYSYWSFVSDYNHRLYKNLCHSSAVYEKSSLLACCVTSAEDENRALISGVAANLNFRGKGYGKRAVLALADFLVSSGKAAYVIALNPSAEGFYEKIGFKKIDIINFWNNNE